MPSRFAGCLISQKQVEEVNKQKKGLVLDINDIKKFDSFGICFQHPTDSKCVLFNLFSCDEFAQPRRQDSDWFKRRITPKILGVTGVQCRVLMSITETLFVLLSTSSIRSICTPFKW
jgi:hypothetical protein